jgi:hypothetical protein
MDAVISMTIAVVVVVVMVAIIAFYFGPHTSGVGPP